MPDVIPTSDLHLAYRVIDRMADEYASQVLEALVLRAAAEVLRLAYRSRTLMDPLPGQETFPVD